MSQKNIVIIGGGISGLATAYSLEERAKRNGKSLFITILEKNNRVGGSILTERENGFIIEGGPDCFISEKPYALQFCKKLGIGDNLLCTNDEFRKTFVLWKGNLHELPEGVMLMIPTRIVPILKSSLISSIGKLRMAMELLIPKKRSQEDESLSEFVCRRLGKDVLDKIAEPLVAGIHAANPDTMSVKSTFPKFVQMEEEYGSLIRAMIAKKKMMNNSISETTQGYTMFMTLKNGLDELPVTIVKSLKTTKIIKDKEAVRVVKSPSKITTGESIYKILLKDGEGVDADAIVFATPSYETARLLSELDGIMSDQLDKIPYISTATVSLAYKKNAVSHPMNGFGFVVPKPEKRKIMAATWVSRKFSYRVPEDSLLIRCFVGGYYNEDLIFMDDEDMIKMVKGELKDIMGINADPILARLYRWKKAMPQYTIGHDERLTILNRMLSKEHGLFLTGSAYRGIGISGCINDADLTADAVIKHFYPAQ